MLVEGLEHSFNLKLSKQVANTKTDIQSIKIYGHVAQKVLSLYIDKSQKCQIIMSNYDLNKLKANAKHLKAALVV